MNQKILSNDKIIETISHENKGEGKKQAAHEEENNNDDQQQGLSMFDAMFMKKWCDFACKKVNSYKIIDFFK